MLTYTQTAETFEELKAKVLADFPTTKLTVVSPPLEAAKPVEEKVAEKPAPSLAALTTNGATGRGRPKKAAAVVPPQETSVTVEEAPSVEYLTDIIEKAVGNDEAFLDEVLELRGTFGVDRISQFSKAQCSEFLTKFKALCALRGKNV